MATRIIKYGAAGSHRIKPYSLSGHAEESRFAGEKPPAWLEEPTPATAAPGRRADEQVRPDPSPGGPPVDLAQIEKQAFESGFEQGERAGMEIAEKKVEAVMRRYAETVLELARLKPVLYSQVEREVVKLALEVSKKIVHREIQADREIIQTLVKVALGHVAEKGAVTVHLHPIDYNYLLERRAELSQATDGREVVLLADKSIERGGCLIQTECGDIDARIEEEFREVERSFFEGMKQ